ncbi:GDP-mannose 4,6-dehydratase [Jatrophihabitans sp. YIM 134969]
MTTALVTGITGQDGTYLTESLLARGLEVHGYVRSGDDAAAAFTERYPEVTLHRGELDDVAAVRATLDAAGPDQVFHLAGISSVALSWERPLAVQQVNAVGAGVLLQTVSEWAAAHGTAPRVLHASTAEIFGAPATSPQDESTPIRPTSPYGASKAYAHLLVGVYRARGMHASNVVLFNHESPRRPPVFVTRKITQGAADIAAGRASELVLGNLDARRDWGWAPDYVEAMTAVVAHPEPDDYVVATGVSHSVQDFVAAAFAAVDLPWEPYVRTDPAFVRPVDAVEQRGDASRARTVLGWEPTVGFEEIVARMVAADVR